MNVETLPTLSPEELRPQVQRILIPTDFSPPAERALAYAVRLAEKSGAELIVLHVHDTLQAPTGCSGKEYLHMKEHCRQRVKDKLASMVENHASGKKPFPTELLALEGIPSHEILRVAKDHDVDIIVIATNGHSTLRRAFLGCTSDKVVRFATCSVLVVREKHAESIAVL